MSEIIAAIPDAAEQLSSMISSFFDSGLAWFAIPILVIDLGFLVFRGILNVKDKR